MRAPHDAVDALGVAVEWHAGALAVRCRGLPISLFNRVIGLGTLAPADPELIDEVVQRARAHEAKLIWFHVASTAPAALTEALTARGFVPAKRARWAKVMRGVEPPPEIATDLRIEELDHAHADDVSAVLGEAFAGPPLMTPLLVSPIGRSPWRAFGAFDGERLVAAGLMFVHGDTAWLGMGGTLASHRGRGAQGAIMARRIREAIAAGCTAIATETGEPIGDEANPSLGNMLRCGFQRVDARANFERAL
jgi:hypothetical protein